MDRSVIVLAVAVCVGIAAVAAGQSVPDGVFRKPPSVPLARAAARVNSPVVAVEVDDFAPGRYEGPMAPSPPHADMNARRAVAVLWRDRPERFIFSHEASYCPLLELPSGAAMCNQFFEGNLGDAELFNDPGRKERNSFVDIVEAGGRRVWVRWTYHCVNMKDDARPRLRGTEDYFAYPNGLILRRMSYESLMPDEIVGYSTQPVELFGVAPVGATIADLFPRDRKQGDRRTHTALDLYSPRRYDLFWDDKGGVRRKGDDATLATISRSRGCALILPFKEKLLFAILGPNSGFAADRNQLIDHCTKGAEGGCEWGQGIWDHWPIGWLNSQTSYWKPGSPYSYSFGSIGQFFVPPGKRIKSFGSDYPETCRDMELNRWTERRVFGVLLGSAATEAEVRRIGRKWLGQGTACLSPAGVRDLR
ncbi:MAG: hypothetical protein NT029_13930 [Armatimonadetes bacterium]|nr:hypothetical protein [Armatimonadota bacterium]